MEKFTDLFHNGSFKGVQLFSSSPEVLEQGERYAFKIAKDLESTISTEQLLANEVTFVHITQCEQDIEGTLSRVHMFQEQNPCLVYLAICPVAITPKHL